MDCSGKSLFSVKKKKKKEGKHKSSLGFAYIQKKEGCSERVPEVMFCNSPHFASRQSSRGRWCRRPTSWRLWEAPQAPVATFNPTLNSPLKELQMYRNNHFHKQQIELGFNPKLGIPTRKTAGRVADVRAPSQTYCDGLFCEFQLLQEAGLSKGKLGWKILQ